MVYVPRGGTTGSTRSTKIGSKLHSSLQIAFLTFAPQTGSIRGCPVEGQSFHIVSPLSNGRSWGAIAHLDPARIVKPTKYTVSKLAETPARDGKLFL